MSVVKKSSSPILKYNTYIFIDVSNIRSTCQKTLRLRVDFFKLITYFRQKYPNLKDIRYYEGIAKDDLKKQQIFESLKDVGYTICSLERKTYFTTELVKHPTVCPNCQHHWLAQFSKKHKSMKSNVDVYLAAEFLAMSNDVVVPSHFILVSCDGDYAEMIRLAISRNKNVTVSVLGTPPVRDLRINTLSASLRHLCRELPRYQLLDISNFKDQISQER